MAADHTLDKQGYVGESWTGWLFDTLQTAGFDVARLTQDLPGIGATGTASRLEIGSARRLYHRLDREACDPLLGYRLSQYLDEGATGFLSPLLWHSPTLADVLNNISQYQWALSENGGFSGHRDRDSVTGESVYVFEYIPVENAINANRHQMLMLACTTINIVRRIMRHQCDINWLNLPKSLNAKKITTALNCECRLIEGNLSIVFDEKSLRLPVSGRDGALYDIVKAHAEKITKIRVKHYSLMTKIKHHIRMRGFSHASIADIELDTGIHRRTLQRILRDTGMSFRSLKQEVLRDEAIKQLANTKCSIAQTAEALGYSETSAFHRAFVQWFGKTPSDFLASEIHIRGQMRG